MIFNIGGHPKSLRAEYNGEGTFSQKGGDWEYRVTSDGILIPSIDCYVDIFVCGGGGAGGGSSYIFESTIGGEKGRYAMICPGGGGGGYYKTIRRYRLLNGYKYHMKIGAGGIGVDGGDGGNGGKTYVYCDDTNENVISADGGSGGKKGRNHTGYMRNAFVDRVTPFYSGGNGGSGGASGAITHTYYANGSYGYITVVYGTPNGGTTDVTHKIFDYSDKDNGDAANCVFTGKGGTGSGEQGYAFGEPEYGDKYVFMKHSSSATECISKGFVFGAGGDGGGYDGYTPSGYYDNEKHIVTLKNHRTLEGITGAGFAAGVTPSRTTTPEQIDPVYPANYDRYNGNNGAANTGGGGGGSGMSSTKGTLYHGGNGGSGIIILRNARG